MRLALVFLLFCLPTHAHEPKSYDLPFHTARSLMLVSVMIDGQSKTLIFDTGAERTIIHALGGDVERRVTVILPGRTVTNFPVIMADLSRMPLTNVGADGVLGQDVLRQFSSFTIDYKTGVVRLTR